MALDFLFQSPPSSRTIGATVGVLLIVRLIWVAVYRIFFHPLANYPGPLLAKLSDIYRIGIAAQGRATYVRHELHQKYGSVVRTGPNELSFVDMASIKDIYGQSAEPCLKDPFFYGGFTLTGTQSVFSETDRTTHARMRRLLSHPFSLQGVLQFEGEIAAKVERYLALVQSSPQPVELHDLTHNLFTDITSQLGFAQSFDILEGKPHQGATDIETYFNICPLYGIFPLARYLPFGIFRAAREAEPRIVRFSQSCIQDFRERLRLGTARYGLLRLLIGAKDEETNTGFSDAELIENAVIFIVAGSTTSATTVLYLLYETYRRPEVKKRLEEEIRTTFPNINVFPDFDTATKLVSNCYFLPVPIVSSQPPVYDYPSLSVFVSQKSQKKKMLISQSQPYLNCVLQEVLRLRGPIPTVAPRVSPGKMIGGRYVPAGVVVSNLPYATQRDRAVFPDPDTFDPDRWEHPTAEMKLMNRPFSSGPRNCVGMHLARVQMLLTVCALVQRFDLAIDPRVTEEMMVQRDQGLMTAMGKKLWVQATPRRG